MGSYCIKVLSHLVGTISYFLNIEMSFDTKVENILTIVIWFQFVFISRMRFVTEALSMLWEPKRYSSISFCKLHIDRWDISKAQLCHALLTDISVFSKFFHVTIERNEDLYIFFVGANIIIYTLSQFQCSHSVWTCWDKVIPSNFL